MSISPSSDTRRSAPIGTDRADFEAEGLLDGVEGERERQARLDLLTELHESGVPLEQLRRAVDESRLALLPVERVLGGDPEFTGHEIAEKAEVDFDFVARQRQALGLPRPDPDARVFSQDDLDAALRTRRFRDAGVDESAGLGLLRLMGQAGAQVAEALRDLIGDTLARPGDTEADLGRRYAEFARATAPQLGETLGYIARLHLREYLRHAEVTRAELASGHVAVNAQEVAVAFADLVGFTRLGADVPASELGELAGRLTDLAAEAAQPPVRLVKTIGDAAMLVSPEPAPLLEATLGLVEAAEHQGEDFPMLRAGVAFGPALGRAGDYYGHTVNLASRVTGIARPVSVLATEDVHDRLADEYRWSFAGERKLKGIGRAVKLFRARRLDADAPT